MDLITDDNSFTNQAADRIGKGNDVWEFSKSGMMRWVLRRSAKLPGIRETRFSRFIRHHMPEEGKLNQAFDKAWASITKGFVEERASEQPFAGSAANFDSTRIKDLAFKILKEAGSDQTNSINELVEYFRNHIVPSERDQAEVVVLDFLDQLASELYLQPGMDQLYKELLLTKIEMITSLLGQMAEPLVAFDRITPSFISRQSNTPSLWTPLARPKWGHFIPGKEHDVQRTILPELVESILSLNQPDDDRSILQLVLASSGFGKTSCLMRLAVDLCGRGCAVLWIDARRSEYSLEQLAPPVRHLAYELGPSTQLVIVIDNIMRLKDPTFFLEEINKREEGGRSQIIVVGASQYRDKANFSLLNRNGDIHTALDDSLPDLELGPFDDDELYNLAEVLESHGQLKDELRTHKGNEPRELLEDYARQLGVKERTLREPKQAVSLLTTGKFLRDVVQDKLEKLQGGRDYNVDVLRKPLVQLYVDVSLFSRLGMDAPLVWLEAVQKAANREAVLGALQAIRNDKDGDEYKEVMDLVGEALTTKHELDAQAVHELAFDEDSERAEAYAHLIKATPEGDAAAELVVELVLNLILTNPSDFKHKEFVERVLEVSRARVDELKRYLATYNIIVGWWLICWLLDDEAEAGRLVELLKSQSQHILYLERAAWFSDFWLAVEPVLRDLALSEDKPQNRDGATAAWKRLFNLYNPCTEQEYAIRLKYLEQAISSRNEKLTALAFEALEELVDKHSTLSPDGPTDIVGQKAPTSWTVAEGVRLPAVMQLLRRLSTSQQERVKDAAIELLIKQSYRWLYDGFLDDLKAVFSARPTNDIMHHQRLRLWIEAQQLLRLNVEDNSVEIDKDEAENEYVAAVKEWLVLLEPQDFAGRLVHFTGASIWHCHHNEADYVKEAEWLATQIYADRELLDQSMGWLHSEQAVGASGLGFRLAALDDKLTLLDPLVAEAEARGSDRLLIGYVRGIGNKGQIWQEAHLNAKLDALEGSNPALALTLAVNASSATKPVERVLKAVTEGRLTYKAFDQFTNLDGKLQCLFTLTQLRQALALLEAAYRGGNEDARQIAFELVGYRLNGEKAEGVESVLSDAQVVEVMWQMVTTWEAPWNVQHAMSFVLQALMSIDAYKVVELALSAMNNHKFNRAEMIVGAITPLAHTYSEEVVKAIGVAVLERKRLNEMLTNKLLVNVDKAEVERWQAEHTTAASALDYYLNVHSRW